MSSTTLRSVLHINRSQQDYHIYDPTGVIVRWTPIRAVRKKRTGTTPYGPRPQKVTQPFETEPQQEDMVAVEDNDDGMMVDDDDVPDMMVSDDEAWTSEDEEWKSEEGNVFKL